MDDSNSCSRPTVLGHARYLRYCLAVLSDNLSPGPLWSYSWSLTLYFIHHAFLHPIIIFCLSMGLLTSGSIARPVTMSINHITGGGGLGSESAGMMRYSSGSFVDFSRLPITETPRTAQHRGPTAAVAVVHKPRPPVNIT